MLFMEPTFDMPDRVVSSAADAKSATTKSWFQILARVRSSGRHRSFSCDQRRCQLRNIASLVVGYGILPIVVALQHRRRESTLL